MDADDVITKEEQIFLLLKAKAKCERHLKAKVPKVHGEFSHSNPDCVAGAGPLSAQPQASPQPHMQSSEHAREAAEEGPTRWFFTLGYREDLVLKSKVVAASSSCSRTPDAKGSGGCKSHGRGFAALTTICKAHANQPSVLPRSFAARHQWYGKQTILPTALLSFPLTCSLSILLKWAQAQLSLSSTSFLFWAAKSLPDVGLEGEEGRKLSHVGSKVIIPHWFLSSISHVLIIGTRAVC